jgi:fumarate reductase flavoprotein subunit
MVRELAQSYAGVDPVREPIPVRPVVHYTMGGIHTDIETATPLPGLFAAGECARVSINGATASARLAPAARSYRARRYQLSQHSLATYRGAEAPAISYCDVITRSQPAERVYGGAAA